MPTNSSRCNSLGSAWALRLCVANNDSGDVTPLVTASSATLGNVIERARVEQLLFNGRFFQTLEGRTTLGMENAGGITGFLWGLRSAMEFQQDGRRLENRHSGATPGRPPGLEGIQEIQAQANPASAETFPGHQA